MNDSHEFISGARALRKHFEKIRASLDPKILDEVEKQVSERTIDPSSAFIIAASKDGDSLTLWRNYGKPAVSYAIALDSSKPLVPLQVTTAEEHPHPPEGWGPVYEETPDGQLITVDDPDRPVAAHLTEDDNGQWVSVVYNGKRHREIVKSTLGEIVQHIKSRMPNRFTIHFPWLSDLLLIKAKGFKDEREVRISYTLITPDWKFLFFRSTPWGVAPYIKLTSAPEGFDAEEAFWGSGKEYARKTAKLPIVHIRIGPTPHRKAAAEALRQLLEQQGYSHVKISTSKIPYR